MLMNIDEQKCIRHPLLPSCPNLEGETSGVAKITISSITKLRTPKFNGLETTSSRFILCMNKWETITSSCTSSWLTIPLSPVDCEVTHNHPSPISLWTTKISPLSKLKKIHEICNIFTDHNVQCIIVERYKNVTLSSLGGTEYERINRVLFSIKYKLMWLLQ